MTDLELARMYVNKAHSSEQRGIEFSISLKDYSKLLNQTRCAYTGIKFCEYINDKPVNKWYARSIDRVDSSKGYVRGNVVAACSGINKFKGIIENDTNPITFDMVGQMLRNIENHDRISVIFEKLKG